MSLETIAHAVRRAKDVLAHRPSLADHDDSAAVSTWQGGQRCISMHPSGAKIATDMPTEVGGTGDQVTPGWLFRAGLASCAATTIASRAAEQGIELTRLEVRVDSRSDARGFLDMPGEDGSAVSAQPHDVRMHVRIAASNATAAQVRELVDCARRCSPVPQAVVNPTPLALEVEVL
jgi:uncharacterized OsmC-like protein